MLDPDLVRAGRETEREATRYHHLHDRVYKSAARDKRERCLWLGEIGTGPDGKQFVRSRLAAMQFNLGERTDTFAGTPPLKCVKLALSRAASIRGKDGERSRVLALRDVTVAF